MMRAGRMGLAWVAGTLAAVSAIGLLGTSGWLISRSAQRPPVLYLMVPVAAVQAFGIGRAAFRYAERLTGHDAALRRLATLRVAAYGRLERLAPAGLAEFRSGDLISRLVSDIDSLTDRWLRVRLPYATSACAGTAAVVVCAAILPSAAAVLAVSLAGVAVAAPLLAGWVARRAERQLAPHRGELAAATVDLLRGAGELAVFGVASIHAPVVEADARVAGCERRAAYGRGGGAAVVAFAAGAALWGALALGAAGVRSGRVAGVALAVLVLIPLATHEVFGALAPAAQQIPRLRVAAARVGEVMSRPDPVAEPGQPATLNGPPYDITIRGLVARWSEDGPAVLNGVDLDVPAGARIAVTGPSGSGKTTLAMVLLRFLEPAGGRVTIGGTDIRALRGERVRSVIGLCAQDAHIFASTLRDNLRIARPDATDDELAGALHRARLLDWVRTLPGGLDTRVGERGARLSGGQRQRLALARVLLADFPVVIFDEPAEHLDERTAGALTRDLLTATEGRTVILITHRPVDGLSLDHILRLRTEACCSLLPPTCSASLRFVSKGEHPEDVASLHRRLDDLEHAVARRVEETCAAFFRAPQAAAGTVRSAWQRRTKGERRWQVAASTAVAIGLQVAVPGRLAVLRPVWVLPALQGVLLLTLFSANPHRIDRESRALRMLGLTLAALISFANAWSLVNLAIGLVRGTEGENAGPLLITGGAIWLTNVIVFGLWYWEFDRGGPVARALGTHPYPDFQFVQMTSPDLAPPDWEPAFADYLYLAFTNASAFSPTDVMPLSRWAKLGMSLQSAISIVTVALIVARAVNILK